MFARAVEVMVIDDQLWAFVASGTAGLKIINVSDPWTPVQLDLDLPVGSSCNAGDVALFAANNGKFYAYAASSTIGIFDVTDPSAAVPVGNLPMGAFFIAVAGEYLVLGTGSQIQVLDLADPEAPSARGSLNVYHEGVDADGTWLYAAGGTQGLHVIDISDPDQPQIVETIVAPGRLSSVCGDGSGLVLAGDDTAVLDVVSLHSP
jgi:hypothetical protein